MASVVIAWLLAALCLLTNPVYAQIKAPYDPPGSLIDVGGYRIHLHCTGEGSPTVMVLGAGFSFDWDLVQVGVEKFTRICTYDPSGTAWSDSGPGGSCPQRLAEIEHLIQAAGLTGPRVLVGLSVGAQLARLYAAAHSADTAGVVIVDHAFSADTPQTGSAGTKSTQGLDSPPALIYKTPITIGVEDEPGFQRLPVRIQRMQRWAESLRPLLPTAATAEECRREIAAAETDPHPLGALPLIVISTANDAPGYTELQTQLLSLSENSKSLFAAQSFHSVEISEPAVIVDAIRQTVEAARENMPLKN